MVQKILIVFALAFGLASADFGQNSQVPIPDGRIVGGSDTDISHYPHQVSMRYNNRHRCGGSILTSSLIVSASHCVIGTVAENMTIEVGSTWLSVKGQELPVDYYIMHEKYAQGTQDYDVAILVLRGSFTFNDKVQPIPLAKERPLDGSQVTVTGWGALTEGGSAPDHLQQVHVNVVSNTQCRRSYPFLITTRMLCAGVPGGGKDACQGDSGGPLIFNNHLLGVVSWGFGCARSSFPGVYASVPDLHDWIVATANAHSLQPVFF